MKYVKVYYPVHYLSISRKALVPATGRLSLTRPGGDRGRVSLPHQHLWKVTWGR